MAVAVAAAVAGEAEPLSAAAVAAVAVAVAAVADSRAAAWAAADSRAAAVPALEQASVLALEQASVPAGGLSRSVPAGEQASVLPVLPEVANMPVGQTGMLMSTGMSMSVVAVIGTAAVTVGAAWLPASPGPWPWAQRWLPSPLQPDRWSIKAPPIIRMAATIIRSATKAMR